MDLPNEHRWLGSRALSDRIYWHIYSDRGFAEEHPRLGGAHIPLPIAIFGFLSKNMRQWWNYLPIEMPSCGNHVLFLYRYFAVFHVAYIQKISAHLSLMNYGKENRRRPFYIVLVYNGLCLSMCAPRCESVPCSLIMRKKKGREKNPWQSLRVNKLSTGWRL